MLRRITALIVSLCSLASFASAQTYSQRRLQINAGILIIESAQSGANAQPMNFTPFVWQKLDQAAGIKPAAWDIVNPRPITQVSPATAQRWTGLASDLGGFTPPNERDPVTKTEAPYWEVRLSTVSDSQLAEYNILLLSAYGYTALNSAEREKLRKYVDAGGVLWVDLADSTNLNDAHFNPLPIPFDKQTYTNPPAGSVIDIFSPVLDAPYFIPYSIDALRLNPLTHSKPVDLAALNLASHEPIESWVSADYSKWSLVVQSPFPSPPGRGPTLSVGKLGDGYMVLTAGGWAAALNRVQTSPNAYDANNRYRNLGGRLDAVGELAAKLAVNMINLASGYTHPGGGSRKPNSNAIDLQPPLLNRFEAPTAISMSQNQSAILYKGIMYVTVGTQLFAFDADPKSDLDGDGDPDDGIRDYSGGTRYDLLWSSRDMGSTLSPPAVGDIPTAAVPDQVYVVDERGVLYAFDSLQLAGGSIQPVANAAPIYTVNPPENMSYDTTIPGGGPYAPTVHDGIIYVAGTTSGGTVSGEIWIIDPLTQAVMETPSTTQPWRMGGRNVASLPEPSGSPTIGYIPIVDGSGGYDRVLYYPGRPQPFNGPTSTASLNSMWLGVRGESPPPNSVTITPADVTIVTRAARQGLEIWHEAAGITGASLGVKLTVLKPNGDPFTDTEMKTYFTGGYTCNIGNLTFALNQPLPAGVGFRVDYTIDWGYGNAALATQVLRGQLFFPDDPNITAQNDKRRIIGNIALSPKGTAYCIVSTGKDNNLTNSGGDFYAVKEDIGRGGFRMLTRYSLYPPHQIVLNQATPFNSLATVGDLDPVTTFEPTGLLRGGFARLTWVGTPSVRNDTVYVVASGHKNNGGFSSFVPFTVLFAFKAEPESPEIRVGDLGSDFTLRQYDVTRSATKGAPTVYNDFAQNQYVYDRREGVLRFDSLMATTRGPVLNAFSTSQPVIIKRRNQPDELLQPDATGSKWSPLQWYSVMHGIQPTGGALTTGQSVFVPGSSIIPNLDQIQFGRFITNGLIYAWNGVVAQNDPFLTADPVRPWIKQLYQVRTTGNPFPNQFEANPDVLWPQLRGMQDGQDWFVRVRQTTTGNSTSALGLAGGEGVLAAWGDRGVYSFSRADFLVADSNRLTKFDPGGNVIWSSNVLSSTGSANEGTVGTTKPLVNPVRAYAINENDVVVADPGANRIARFDLSGREIRSITDFKLTATPPDGYKAGDPLTLNAPRDVVVFITRPNANEIMTHYLIADSGNRRIVDIVDRVDANNGKYTSLGELYWQSPSNYSGKEFAYNSVNRVFVPGLAAGTGSYYYVAGMSSAQPSSVNSGLDSPTGSVSPIRENGVGNSGIVVFDPANAANNIIINSIEVPSSPANVFYDFATNSFTSNARNGYTHSLSNLTSVTARVVNIPTLPTADKIRVAVMVTDASGVYEVIRQDTTVANSPWIVRWMMPNEAYRAFRRLGTGAPSGSSAANLRANFARRLDNGNILVTNGYVGRTLAGNEFSGEVVEFNGDIVAEGAATGYDPAAVNLGFDLRSIEFELPPITGARGLVLPVFADRR